MATIFCAAVTTLQSPQTTLNEVKNKYKDVFKQAAGSSRFEVSLDPLSGTPQAFTAIAPKKASDGTADDFLTALKTIETAGKIAQVKALPEPLKLMHIQNVVLGGTAVPATDFPDFSTGSIGWFEEVTASVQVYGPASQVTVHRVTNFRGKHETDRCNRWSGGRVDDCVRGLFGGRCAGRASRGGDEGTVRHMDDRALELGPMGRRRPAWGAQPDHPRQARRRGTAG